MVLAADPGAPAGGAALGQIVLAALLSLIVFVPLALTVLAERAGRPNPVGRLADAMAAREGQPRWVALPGALLIASILSAGFGVYWDVPWHVDRGRDVGPLANPGHYFIYFGLMGVLAAGVLSCALARKPLPARTLRLAKGWRVPLGSALVTACGVVALVGFPLDDGWHRLFGQDVTEWGPTHVLMIGGAVTAMLGQALLQAEGRQVTGSSASRFREVMFAGGWLIGINVLLMEFDVGIPQYPMVSQVVIIAALSGWALGYARLRLGRGGALLALIPYLALRGLLFVVVPVVLGRTNPHFTLYLGEAVAVELAALLAPPARSRYVFGAVAGLLIGTVGVVSEWAWTNVGMPLGWPGHLIPLFMVYAVLAGVGGAVLGVWHADRLDDVVAGRGPGAFPVRHGFALAAGALVVVLLAIAIPRTHSEVNGGTVTLAEAAPDPGGTTAYVSLKLDRPAAADGAVWFYALAWQGGTTKEVPMVDQGGGVWRTAEPLPLYGKWKTLIRLHRAPNYVVALPVYMPADDAIPVPSLITASGEHADFVKDMRLLQREVKPDVPGWLWGAAYAALFLVYGVLWTLIGTLTARAAAWTRTEEKQEATA